MASLPIVTLKYLSDAGEEQELSLCDGEEITVGRSDENRIMLNDPSVSRRHAAFSATSFGAVVADLGSTNGTFLNGESLSSMKDLSSGDIVNIGACSITVDLPQNDSNANRARSKTVELKPVDVTILVASIRDYNSYIQALQEKDLSELLAAWREKVVRVVEDHGGKVEKMVGGDIVATWCGSSSPECAKASYESAVNLLEASSTPSDELAFAYKVLIHSGRGMQGKARAEDGETEIFTLIGDPMSATLELASHSTKLDSDFIISRETAELVENGATFAPVATLEVTSGAYGPIDLVSPKRK